MENHMIPESLRSKRIERAVEISAEMFLKNGIEAVKMTDIAKQCGFGVATLYRYFGTKNGITIAAMTYLWDELNKMFSGITSRDFEGKVFDILQVGYTIGNTKTKPIVKF